MKLQKHVIFNVSNDTYSSVSSLSLYKNNSGTSKTRVPGSISSRWSKNYVHRRIMVNYVYFWEKNDEFRQNIQFKKMRVLISMVRKWHHWDKKCGINFYGFDPSKIKQVSGLGSKL